MYTYVHEVPKPYFGLAVSLLWQFAKRFRCHVVWQHVLGVETTEPANVNRLQNLTHHESVNIR